MESHSHKHHKDEHHKADFWTNLSFLKECLVSGFSNYSFASAIVSLTYSDEEEAQQSYLPMIFGISMACLGMGSAVAHRALNIHHQHGHSHGHSHGDEHCDAADHVEENSQHREQKDNQYEELSNHSDSIVDSEDDAEDIEAQKLPAETLDLSRSQKTMLLMNYITGVGDPGGTIPALVLNVLANNNISLSRISNIGLYGGATVFGLFSSVADTRNCRNAMIKRNTTKHPELISHEDKHSNHEDEKAADFWTNIFSLKELVVSACDNYSLASSVVFLAFKLAESSGKYYWEIITGGSLALLSLGSAYTHRILSAHHQHTHNHSHASDTQHHHLSIGEKTALVADYITHVGEPAGAIPALIETSLKTVHGKQLSAKNRIIVYAASTGFGLFSAIADVRTCSHAMQEENKKHRQTR
jgi:hypothetical protein